MWAEMGKQGLEREIEDFAHSLVLLRQNLQEILKLSTSNPYVEPGKGRESLVL